MDVLDVALAVARAMERCGVDYFLGGSLASSYQGEPRATNDVDFVVDLSETDAAAFAKALGTDFEVDVDALTEAVREGRSWNVIHLPSVTKVDLIPRGGDPFDESEFFRRRPVAVRPGEMLSMKTPEDTVLRKLLWYRDGGGISDRHWRDLVSVLRHSHDAMDSDYLSGWASRLGLDDLLSRAQSESRMP